MNAFEKRYVNVEDFACAARRRLPKIFADYIDGGAFSETTLARNLTGLDQLALRQRVLMPAVLPDLSVRLGDEKAALPFGPGPVGFLGLYRRNGDIAVAKAAAAANVPFILSTFSINGLQTIRKASGQAPDFQLYLDRDPEVNAAYLNDCRAYGVKRIFLTVDTAITSVRERDIRNGFRATHRLTPGLIWQFMQRPQWSFDLLRGGMPEVELVKGRPEFGRGALAQAANLSGRLENAITWDTVRKLRDEWQGELIIKGIADPEDAAVAAKSGVDGIVLSNHGGRQLDHGVSTISQVAGIRSALGSASRLYVDGGFRRGSDIVKALALGADFILLGRPFAWAVAAAGEDGATKLFSLLRREIEVTLRLMGVSSIQSVRTSGASSLLKLTA